MDHSLELHQRLDAYRTLHRTVEHLNSARNLTATLQAVVDNVVASLGFHVAAVNLVVDDTLEVVAVAGPTSIRDELQGQVGSRAAWDELLESSEPWGSLRYFSLSTAKTGDVPVFIPSGEVDADPDADDVWNPEDALVAPLRSPEGELVGVLSVDLPVDGRMPGPIQRELLEMFAAQAANAIDTARLHSKLLVTVADLHREQQALRASEESFRLAFENAPSGMAMRSLRPHDHGRLRQVNAALCELVGYPARDLIRGGLRAIVHPEDRSLFTDDTDLRRLELRLQRSDGTHVWVSVTSSVVHGANVEPDFQLIHIYDVSERHARELRLAHRAAHDPLTGLPNRTELRNRLMNLLGAGEPVTVLFCDLDDFKKVNDSYGHDVGDAVLVELGRRLRLYVREDDLVARLGGDEFVLVVPGVDSDGVGDLVERLTAAVSRPVYYRGHAIRVGASFGQGTSAQGTTVDDLLRSADRAMYRAKDAKEATKAPAQRSAPAHS